MYLAYESLPSPKAITLLFTPSFKRLSIGLPYLCPLPFVYLSCPLGVACHLWLYPYPSPSAITYPYQQRGINAQPKGIGVRRVKKVTVLI